MSLEQVLPDWPAPPCVHACVTTRQGGVSGAPFASFNLATHVGDDPLAVNANRARLRAELPADPRWLAQVHGTACVDAARVAMPVTADASFTVQPGVVCAVLTADCLPVLFCNRAGSVVAAAHAGWRGLLAGVLENTVVAMACPPGDIIAWLGPAIGPGAFEVGPEVREAFLATDPALGHAFVQNGQKSLCDLYAIARHRLLAAGLASVHGGGLCTFADAQHFYSYRRDGSTGRMASLIWLA